MAAAATEAAVTTQSSNLLLLRGPQLPEPWASGERALRDYEVAVQQASYDTNLTEVCLMHATLLAGAVGKLPQNAAPTFLISTLSSPAIPILLPQTAAGMVESLFNVLVPAWCCEAHLAPPPLAEAASAASAFAAAEAKAAKLAGILKYAPEQHVAHSSDWVVAACVERLANFFRWLSAAVRRIIADMQRAPRAAAAFEAHGVFLYRMGRLISHDCGFIQLALEITNPTVAAAIRCNAAGSDLAAVGKDLQDHLRLLEPARPADDGSGVGVGSGSLLEASWRLLQTTDGAAA